MTMKIFSRILMTAVAIGKFVIIGVVFSPYFMRHETNLLYILQVISATGVGLSGLYDLSYVLKCETSVEEKGKLNGLDACILSTIYTVPFVTVCWMIHIIRNEPVTLEEYNMSVYISLCYFFTSTIVIVVLIFGCFCFLIVSSKKNKNKNVPVSEIQIKV